MKSDAAIADLPCNTSSNRAFETLLIRLRPLLAGIVVGLAAFPGAAGAIDANQLIDIVIDAADPSLAPAKPLIACAVDNPGNQVSCMENAAVQQAKQQAGGFVPFDVNDNRIHMIILVVQDVGAKNWPKAVGDGGPVVIQTVACALLPLAGPAKGAACSVVGYVITHDASVMKDVYEELAGGPNWGGLVTTIAGAFGPDVACQLIPDMGGAEGALKDLGCGVLGTLLAGAKDTIDDLYKGGKALWYGLGDVTGLNDPKAMSQEAYYALAWQPWYHRGVWLCLTKNCKGFGDGGGSGDLLSHIWHPCKDYFASHDMTSSTAQSACDNMRDKKFVPQVKALVKAMSSAPDVYVENMRPWAKTWAVEDYGKNMLPQRKSFIQQNATAYFRGKFPFPEPDPSRCDQIKQLYSNSLIKQVAQQMYSTCVSDANAQLPSPTAWTYSANLAAQKFVPIYNAEMAALGKKLPAVLTAGCLPPPGWTGDKGLKLVCGSYAGYQACLSTLSAGAEKQHCMFDQQKADQEVVKTIMASLGSKRCLASGTSISCTRPWKHEKCATLRAQLTGGVPTKIQCKEGPVVAVAAFVGLTQQAKSIVFTLNGGILKNTGMKTQSGEGLVLAVPPKSDNCKSTWDPLTITCKDPQVLATLPSAMPGVAFGQCPPDANQDGADKPCYGGPISKALSDKAAAKAGVAASAAGAPGGAAPKPQNARKLGGGVPPGGGVATAPMTALGGGTKPLLAGRTGIQAAPNRGIPATKPQLRVASVQTRVEPNCQSPQPAMTATIFLRNSGGALPAASGTLLIKERGGAALSSARVQLPAIGAGQLQPVVVATIAPAHYSTLAGPHQLEVDLDPLIEGEKHSFDKPAAYPFSVSFPAEHCARRLGAPAPLRAPPAPARQTR